ncbi:MAG: CBS domain-containing protein [Halobacteriota archaeon]|jgi:IMP dehydrogenase
MSSVKVEDYMTRDVITVKATDTVKDVISLIKSTKHDGFPVVKDKKIIGYVSALDILLCDPSVKVADIMSVNLVVARCDMDLFDAARVLFRSDSKKLPVIDDNGFVLGIISTTDVIRSQIERATPDKVWKLMRTLRTIHKVQVEEHFGQVKVLDLVPTQSKIFADELEGRRYELEKGLAEPLIVIQKRHKTLLVDGHHRAVAAQGLDIREVDAYIITMERDVPLGMERTAENIGLRSLADIQILESSSHPLIEITRRSGSRNV